MTRFSDERAREIADAVDDYDQQIADGQEGKRETFQTARIELENLGLDKAAVKIELDGLKKAIKARALRRSDPEKLDAAESAEALSADYLDVIDRSSRAPRATRTREDRSRARTSEAMADHKDLSWELAEAGLISPEAHAENVAIADGIAKKFGAGVTKNTEMDRETGPGKADGHLPAESDRVGGQGDLVPEASHAGPGENPGANSPEGASEVAAPHSEHVSREVAGQGEDGVSLPDDPSITMGSRGPALGERQGAVIVAGAVMNAEAQHPSRVEGPALVPSAPAPRTPLIENGHTWRNLVEAYGWPEDRVQELWLAGTPATQRFEMAEAV